MVDEKDTVKLRLRELAEVLGVPVDRFYQEVPAAQPQDTAELLRLWHRVKTPGGRLAALEALTKILNEER
ncbi:hypothetical protein [Methylobacterium brachiatum]